MSKKIAFTGYRGDVGSILFSKLKSQGIECVYFDDDKKDVDILLHLAAKSPPASNDQIIISNIFYLQDIVSSAKKNGVKTIIFFSAVSVYGSQNREMITESDTPIDPSFYGISKLLGEKYLSECGIPTLALRLPAILGYKNKTNFISRTYESLINNNELIVFNHNKKFNNFISIDSLASFIAKLEFRRVFDVVNLASAPEFSIGEIVSFMKTKLCSESNILFSDQRCNFFNICTKKAEDDYGFVPENSLYVINKWIEEKKLRTGGFNG